MRRRIENLGDILDCRRGRLTQDQIRDVEVADALVDTGATFLSLPRRLIERLGLRESRTRTARTAGGLRESRVYEPVRLTVQGRECFPEVADAARRLPSADRATPAGGPGFCRRHGWPEADRQSRARRRTEFRHVLKSRNQAMNDLPVPPNQAGPPRWQPINAIDRRVLGVLVEKAKTVPSAYPMSINAIATGANQKNNRFPVMQLEPDQVEESLERLRGLGAVGLIQGYGRVAKYRHYLYEWLGVDKVELAVMTGALAPRRPDRRRTPRPRRPHGADRRRDRPAADPRVVGDEETRRFALARGPGPRPDPRPVRAARDGAPAGPIRGRGLRRGGDGRRHEPSP